MLNQAAAVSHAESRDTVGTDLLQEIGQSELLERQAKSLSSLTSHSQQEIGLATYEQIHPSLLVDSLPELPRLWTHVILSAEQGSFRPPLIQDHEFGVFINAGDLYTRRELTSAEEVIVSLARGRVLEIGAGFARVSRCLREHGFDVVTTDADPELVAMYRARGWSSVGEITLPDVPTSFGRFDTIITLRGVLSLAGEIDQVYLTLQRLRQLLNPGGRLIFTSSKVNTLLFISGRSPLEYRYRYLYQGCRSPWLRATALPEWLAVPLLRGLGFDNVQILEPPNSDGAGYYAIASLSR
jgi:2-polyprenyl-3-methyl-5-hydroxy-6-metoxy-1,4-benzoquinol methylase